MVGPVGVVAVVGGEDRRADLLGDVEQPRVRLMLCRDPVILQLDEEVVPTEDVLQAGRLFESTSFVAVEQRLQDVSAETSGGCDQPLGVPLQQLPVHPGLVVVALQEGEAGQLDEIPVPTVVLGEQGQVVVELLATFGVTAGVIHATASRRTLAAVVVGHVGLGADDRLDALPIALPVEVEHPVHVAVVGHPDRRLSVLDGLRDEFVETRRSIEHGEFGVDVEMGEGVGHGQISQKNYSGVIRTLSHLQRYVPGRSCCGCPGCAPGPPPGN